jgi:hypothetical protein
MRYFEANELFKRTREECGATMRGCSVEFSKQIMDANARDEDVKKKAEGLSAAGRERRMRRHRRRQRRAERRQEERDEVRHVKKKTSKEACGLGAAHTSICA